MSSISTTILSTIELPDDNWRSIFSNFDLIDLGHCCKIGHKWNVIASSDELWRPFFVGLDFPQNTLIKEYVTQRAIFSQDQFVKQITDFVHKKLSLQLAKINAHQNPKWTASWSCHFPLNGLVYKARIIIGNNAENERIPPSPEESDYGLGVQTGGQLPDPNRREIWGLPYEEEACFFLKELPKKAIPLEGAFIKSTTYRHVLSTVFDKRKHPLIETVIAAITLPNALDGFVCQNRSQNLNDHFIETVRDTACSFVKDSFDR